MKGANRFSFELENIEPQELEELNDDTTDENDRSYIKRARAINDGNGLISSSVRRHRGYRCTAKVKIVTIVGILLGTIIYYNQLFFENSRLTPLARREEDQVIYAGTPPPGWDPRIPRQSADSEYSLINPPIAVEDPYGWMRDETRSDQEVLQHLEDNNHYTRVRTRHLKKTEEILYNEMKSFILETSHTFPNLKGDYYYYRRTIQGMPYPLHVRAPKAFNDGDKSNRNNDQFNADYLKKHLSLWDGSKSMPILPNEIVYLNENIMAQGYDYFNVGSIELSPSQELMAYTVDIHGNEFYQLFIQRIDSGNIIFPYNGHQNDSSRSPFIISGQILWGATDDNLFYTKTDEAERSYQVFCRTFDFSENHVTGSDALSSEEKLLFEELDSLYYVSIDKTSDGKYLLICNDSSESSEVHYINLSDSSNLSKSPSIISNRAQGVLYSVDHLRGFWLILSNRGRGPDLRLFRAKVEGDTTWIRLMDPDDDHPLLDRIPMEDLLVFENHILIKCRKQGLNELWVGAIDADSNVVRIEELKWDTEPAHSVDLGINKNFNASSIIVKYESLTTPIQYVQVDLREPSDAGTRITIMKSPTPSYQKSEYACDRINVISRDGKTEIPVSMVYLKSTMQKAEVTDSFVPIHLYAYGAYGYSIEDTFSFSRIPLLDRGFIYAIAHVRGGGELGRQWYEDGKFLTKKNTFNDFIDVARYFVRTKKWTTPAQMSCEGRSAGGLTIGSVLNQAPDMFRVAILGVPFVDLIATMIDASIPLTSGEWEEWGNPNEEKYFQYMMDYSPMNNIQAGAEYPSCLIKAGLYDPRVAYWEPLKYTASLRYGISDSNNEDRPICLKTDMAAGHFSASDRYKHIESIAFDYSFLLWQLGIYDGS